MSSRSYILQIILWYQSLKCIHYRALLIFQNKKTTDLRVKTWGGIKDMLFPDPPGIYALAHNVSKPYTNQRIRNLLKRMLSTSNTL